ncbi:MAG: hypothetical protein ACLP9L_21215 [Thermoguttaceae bacterium]
MLENEGVALRAIHWSEIFPWLSITRSFRLAVSLRLMTFGAVAVLLTLLGWWGIAGIFSHEGAPNSSWTGVFEDQSAWRVIDRSVPNRPFARSVPTTPVPSQLGATDSPGLRIHVLGPMIHTWALLSQPVWRILSIQPPTSAEPLTVMDFLSLLLSALWSLAVWAYFGAAISRVAAVQLATGEPVGWGAALRWATAKWLAYFAAPLLPMLGVALVVLPVLVLGILMKADFLAVLTALIWPLVLAGAFVMTLLLIGVLLGWPLMWATISVEGTDSFDALNRTYAYVFQRPLRYFFYMSVAALIGWLGWFVVENFAASVIWLASWAASWGAGSARIEDLTAGSGDTSLAHAASWLIAFWGGWVKLLAIGYAFSYFGVASTAIYFLLRRDVDARETDEVFLDADTSEEKFGLPKLQKDAAGAPEIAESAAAEVASADGKAKDTPSA